MTENVSCGFIKSGAVGVQKIWSKPVRSWEADSFLPLHFSSAVCALGASKVRNCPFVADLQLSSSVDRRFQS